MVKHLALRPDKLHKSIDTWGNGPLAASLSRTLLTLLGEIDWMP